MIRTTILLLKNKKGDITWSQIVMAILAVIILAIMFYVSLRSKKDIGSVSDKLGGLLS